MTALADHANVDAGRAALCPPSLDVRCSVSIWHPNAKGATIAALSRYEHETHRVDFDGPKEYGGPDWEAASIADGANAITSKISAGPFNGWHTIALDLDVPIRVVPSSTPGHSHVYIDVALPWWKYERLLVALADAGVIETGYAEVSKTRGFTRLRLPWIRKDTSNG